MGLGWMGGIAWLVTHPYFHTITNWIFTRLFFVIIAALGGREAGPVIVVFAGYRRSNRDRGPA